MDFTSDTDTIVKLQSLNNTINNLEKTYQGLLQEAKNITKKQEKIITKIEEIENLSCLLKEIGGYEKLEKLLSQIEAIAPFLENLQLHQDNIQTNLEKTENKLNNYYQIDQELTEKINLIQNNIDNFERKLEQIGGTEGLESLSTQIILTQEKIESFTQELENNLREKMQNNLTEFSQNIIPKIDNENTIKPSTTETIKENPVTQPQPAKGINVTELTWETIISKEPLVGIIKKYAETYRIEKLYTANTEQVIYGIKRTTIRIIIILQNIKAKSIILRDEDKRKELNLTPQEANFIYQYIDSYLQPIA